MMRVLVPDFMKATLEDNRSAIRKLNVAGIEI